jgi:uncharacterized protein YndB with AHSA1/START domain
MKDVADSATPLQLRLIKKRFVIPIIFIGLVAVLLVWEAIRGNSTDSEPHNPSSPSDAALTQLLQTPDRHKQIRAAIIIAAAPEQVWKTVTNYDHFSEIFPNISTSKGARESNGSWHVTGEVHSIAGRWPMDVHVQHQESATKFVASWDEPHGAWKINRGSWVVAQHGPGETLLEYYLELRVSPFPDFVVRAVLLDQLRPVVRAVAIASTKFSDLPNAH